MNENEMKMRIEELEKVFNKYKEESENRYEPGSIEIRDALKISGVSANHLADELQVSRRWLTDMLNNPSLFKIGQALRIAELTGYPVLSLNFEEPKDYTNRWERIK